MIKNIWSALFGQSAGMCLTKNGLSHEALNTWDVIFYHKIYSNWILILYLKFLNKNSKLVRFWLIGRYLYLFKMACIVGPKKHELANFFIKMDSLSVFRFCIGNYWQFLILVHAGSIGKPLFCQNGPHYGAPNTGADPPICPKLCRFPQI